VRDYPAGSWGPAEAQPFLPRTLTTHNGRKS